MVKGKSGADSGYGFHPDRWPPHRRAINKILRAEGPQPVTELIARVEHLVPPDRGLHQFMHDKTNQKNRVRRLSTEQMTRSGQRSVIFATIHSGTQTGFYRRWITDEDISMLDLGPAGKRYYEERDAQGDQSAPVQRTGEGTDRTD